MLESTVESCTIQYAEQRGWWHRKCVWLGRRGAPDQIFVRRGMVLFVEFKKPGKPPNRQQAKQHGKLRNKGANVFVIDTLEQGRELFDRLEQHQ